jgi:hypothetical protein
MLFEGECMTNRLPKQEPEIVDVQSFMEQHLADFIKEQIKAGCSKKNAIQWAADRFEHGGKFNLQSVASPFLKRSTETGMVCPFMYEEGQVYKVADIGTVLRGLDEINNGYDWASDALQSLAHKVVELQECGIIMIWRMYLGMSSTVEGGIQFISYIGGSEEDSDGEQATLTGSQTGTIMVSCMDLLVQHDILELIGQGDV